MEKKKKRLTSLSDNLTNQTAAAASAARINQYGKASLQHIKSYTGIDYETGNVWTKGLKALSKEKINPDYEMQNTKAKAGFAAEMMSVARQNEENILNGKTERVYRTDDIGRVNDPHADTTVLDVNGKEIGERTQIKFVGNTPKDTFGKLMSKQYDKYFENSDKVNHIEIANDKYDGVIKIADQKLGEYEAQLKKVKALGNKEAEKSIKNKINKIKQLKRTLKKSSVSTNEAIDAVKSPELSMLKDMGRLAHKSGLEAATTSAKAGALIQGGMSIIKVVQGELTPEEGIKQFTTETVKVAANGYVTGAGAATLAATLQTSSSSLIKSIGNSNLPAIIVSNVANITSTLYDFFSGKITGVECAAKLGQTGANIAAGSYYAAVGQVIIPIPVVGAAVGGLVGTLLSNALYGNLVAALQAGDIARERRIIIEKECEAYDKYLENERIRLQELFEEYFADCVTVFNDALSDIRSGLVSYNVNQVIEGGNKITEKLGRSVQYRNMSEFEEFMKKDEDFVL